MNYRYSTYIVTVLVFIAGYLLFSMKREVEGLNFELNEVQKQIKHEQNTIALLKAEYSYLANPQRLRKLAGQYLSLAAVEPEQMMYDPLHTDIEEAKAISTSLNEEVKVLSSNNTGSGGLMKVSSKSVRWRYKAMSEKYLRKASVRRGYE